MGLRCSHGAWAGTYFQFDHFRERLASACGVKLCDFEARPPNTGTCPEERVRGALAILNHSDCDGDISPEDCVHVAAFLRWAVLHPPGGDSYRARAEQFASGCDRAASLDQPLLFS